MPDPAAESAGCPAATASPLPAGPELLAPADAAALLVPVLLAALRDAAAELVADAAVVADPEVADMEPGLLVAPALGAPDGTEPGCAAEESGAGAGPAGALADVDGIVVDVGLGGVGLGVDGLGAGVELVGFGVGLDVLPPEEMAGGLIAG